MSTQSHLIFLRAVSPFEDGDFSAQRFAAVYEADLANGLGNLVSRLPTPAENLEPFLPETARKISIAPGCQPFRNIGLLFPRFCPDGPCCAV